ncbi:hypothetical protein [Tenacibaculum soleae]|uniref:hypothetical protein n=1 Tax=Tenacibaculum soleae TaxID=447689 RepID=UPI002301F922|nr:hypothetical protein [Tenacibaculum soleae]
MLKKTTILKVMLIYILVIILTGVFRAQLIFSYVEIIMSGLDKLSTYSTIIFGAFFSCLILYLIRFIIIEVNNYFTYHISKIDLSYAIVIFILLLSLAELVKVFYFYLFLKPLLIENSRNLQLIDVILNSDFKKYCDETDYIFYLFGSIVFFVITIKNKKFIPVSFVISFLFGSMLATFKYVIN